MKMDKLLRLNLQHFSEDAGGDFGGEEEFDFDKFDEEFENSYQEETQDQDSTEHQEGEQQEEVVDEPKDEDGEGEDEPKDDIDPSIHDDDVHKRNQAFKQLREQAQEGQKFKAFVEKVAELNGMTPEQVIQKFEEQQLQQEAQQKGVDPEIYKRLKTLEEENEQIKTQALREKFNAQADMIMKKYEVSLEEMEEFIREATQKGIDLYATDMEVAFNGLRHEKILEAELKKAQQEYLAQKKERQTKASLAHDGGVTNDDNLFDDIAKEVAKEVADW